MNAYRVKTVLWLASIALAALVVLAAVRLALWPVRIGATNPQAAPSRDVEASGAGNEAHPLEHYAVTWQRDLRRPLYDPPPIVAPKRARPELKIRLTGTVVEPGFTYALFATGDGKTVLARVGQKVEGAEVKSISDASVTVLFAGEMLKLKVQKKETYR